MTTNFLSFVFVLGILVFVHEFGHFIIAKWVGVRVHVFSIGFGPRLFGFRRGGTDYRISALPFGGYVRMAGDNPAEESSGEPEEFNSRTVPERMAILLAGPLMNLLCAVLFFALIYHFGVQQLAYLDQSPEISWVQAGSRADSLGIKIGDKIIAVENTPVNNWREVQSAFAPVSGGTISLTIRSAETERQLKFGLSDSMNIRDNGFWGAFPDWRYVVLAITPDSPAEKAGLQIGDEFLEINGEPVHVWATVQTTIEQNAGKPLDFTLLREGQRVNCTIVPRLEEQSEVGRIGIASNMSTVLVKSSIGESLQKGVRDNIVYAGLLFEYLGRVFSGKESGDQIGSVISIAVVAGEAARLGWDSMLRFMGFLSLQLGILNLLPIPVLDGGNLMILTIEGISGRPVSMKSRGIAQAIGLVILLGILVFALSNDISRHILN